MRQGHFEWQRVRTPFLLLKWFRTPKMTKMTIFFGVISPDPRKWSRCLDPDTNFRLACQRSHCFCVTRRLFRCEARQFIFVFVLFQSFWHDDDDDHDSTWNASSSRSRTNKIQKMAVRTMLPPSRNDVCRRIQSMVASLAIRPHR